MRKLVCVALLVVLAGGAYAELQNVEVGGTIRIRGRYWHTVLDSRGRSNAILGGAIPSRPIGPFGMTSAFDFDKRGNDLSFVEHRTNLKVSADFTEHVSAVISLDSYDRWGEDFRSDYVTGLDMRANSNNDVEIFESYIIVDEMWDQPLRLTVGRQELVWGKGWLVGSQISPTLHISYDAATLTYSQDDDFDIMAVYAKLAENSPALEDGDVNLYGVHGTYKALEPVDFSLYWVAIRDNSYRGTANGPIGEWIEDVVGLDDYDAVFVHTVGLRAFGASEGFDYDLELAYQWGEAGAAGALFPVASLWGAYGDDNAHYNGYAGDLTVGYTFDAEWQPRVFVTGAYFSGEDDRDISFLEAINPFRTGRASLSFNRLMSAKWYTSILDILGGAANLSNFWCAGGGVQVKPKESLTACAQAQYFGVVEPFDWPPTFQIGQARVPVLPLMPWVTDEAPTDIGVITHVWLKYDYSEDLFFKVGWEHLFSGEAVHQGSFTKLNGLDLFAGTDNDDSDYVYFDTGIKF